MFYDAVWCCNLRCMWRGVVFCGVVVVVCGEVHGQIGVLSETALTTPVAWLAGRSVGGSVCLFVYLEVEWDGPTQGRSLPRLQ